MRLFVRFRLHCLPLLTLFVVCVLCSCVREANESAPVENGWSNAATYSPSYVVRPGDTLYSIAWAFGLDYRNLALNNQLQAPYHLVAGQKLNMVMRATVPAISKSAIAKPISQQDLVVRPRSLAKAPASKVASLAPKLVALKALPKLPVRQWLRPAQGQIVRAFSALPFGNKGIDIRGQYGEAIRAAASGQVVYAGDGIRGYGNLIILKHNDSFLSAYAYNKTINVKEGSWVKAGQMIASMGRNDAGNVLLHFEIRRNGKPVNPLNYLSH